MNLLLTGANGMLGAQLVKYFQKHYDVYATGLSLDGLDFFENYLPFDLSIEDYTELIEWSNPDAIIHCAAIINSNYCDKHPLEALNINGITLKKFSCCVDSAVRIIYISTDAVFPSSIHLAKEDDCTNAESVYGKSKELGEFFLVNSEVDYTIVRTTIVGFHLKNNKEGFTKWILDSSVQGKDITLFDDVLFTPIECNDLAKRLELILESPLDYSKIKIHIAGGESCTKYEFGMALLNFFRLPTNKVKKGKISEFSERVKRSTDQTLDCELFATKSGSRLPGLDLTLRNLKKYYNESQRY